MKEKATEKKTTKNAAAKRTYLSLLESMGYYFTTKSIIFLIIGVIIGYGLGFLSLGALKQEKIVSPERTTAHWFLLHRKSNVEYLYKGEPGNKNKSILVRTFNVKTGIPGERPTPLPELYGKEYWIVTKKFDSSENPETAPFFIELDVPAPEVEPYGPVPYVECVDPLTGKVYQCNWQLPGPFGLHGVNGDLSRLSLENLGSSGCIRHTDEDIVYLYNLLDPTREEIRYYINDI